MQGNQCTHRPVHWCACSYHTDLFTPASPCSGFIAADTEAETGGRRGKGAGAAGTRVCVDELTADCAGFGTCTAATGFAFTAAGFAVLPADLPRARMASVA